MNSVTQFIKQQKYLKYVEAKRKPKQKKKKNQKSHLDILAAEVRGKDYPTFLKSKYWKEVKKLVLKRDNHMCAVCKAGENLQIHHDSYKHHFYEHKNLDDLITLCGKCHNDYHLNIA